MRFQFQLLTVCKQLVGAILLSLFFNTAQYALTFCTVAGSVKTLTTSTTEKYHSSGIVKGFISSSAVSQPHHAGRLRNQQIAVIKSYKDFKS